MAAANSALQRARATMQEHLPRAPAGLVGREPSAEERELLARFIDAHERCDAAAAVAIAATDIRVTMPPLPVCFDGIDDDRRRCWNGRSAPSGRATGGCVPTMANRMPTAASYLRRPGDTEFRAFKLDVLRVEDGEIAEITTFGPTLFPAFGLPSTLRRA